MKQQDIEAIIAKIEDCKKALQELQKVTSDVANSIANDENESDEANVHGWMLASAFTTIFVGCDAQFDALAEVIKDINKK